MPRTWLTVAGTLLVVGLGAAIAARTVDVERLLATLRDVDPWLLGLATGVYALSWPLRGRRYDDVLAAMDRRCGLVFCTAAVFLSQTANLVVPARAGDGLRAYLLADRRDVPYTVGVASLAVERAFDLVALSLVGGAAVLGALLAGRSVGIAAAQPGTPVLAAAAVGVAATLGGAVTVGVARSDRAIGPWLRTRTRDSRLAGVVDAVVRTGAAIRAVASDGRALVSVTVASLAVWGLDVLTALVVVVAVLDGVGPVGGWTLAVAVTLAVCVGNLAKVLPLSQGGVGLYEAAFTGLLVAVTPVAAGTALAAAILDHALKNGVTLVGGALAGVALDAAPTAAPAESGTGHPAEDAGSAEEIPSRF